ncbi:FAD binding domain-containing protein [Natrarchaeobius oligotrophus]|uniref:Xanthine dehydrogenase family protein subunit M n=1 Tax=Natrarchaeobius chitinivorans TaxID=1679083 RepID=A0A3N6MAB7_NATCH|nr:xanthine dehydrogenase family protein subunit M [Natrarchaeobius chitinivorans]RQG99417.1 xanthine dehydrogenase family protein subunit M [Natrarchaeobius chitinivorans]
MKSEPFVYHSPSSVEEVVSLMNEHDHAELVAGNQSLAIQMNNRLATPDHLIDLNGVDELAYVDERDGEIEIGAMTTHKTIANSDAIDRTVPILAEAAQQIAGPSVRNVGTLGGGIGEADPAGNYPTVLTALDATITITSESGDRDVGVDEFFIAYMMTEVGENEMITGATVPTDPFPIGRTGMSFLELKRVPHTWPKLSAAGIVRVDDPTRDDPTVEEARLTFANASDTPLRVEAAESAVEGTSLTDDALEEAAEIAMDSADPADEMQAEAEYKEEQVGIFTKRALREAYDRALDQ